MYEFRDLARLTTVATVTVAIYLMLDLLSASSALIEGPLPPDQVGISGLLALLGLLAIIVCFCVVGRWIYRASVNAHAISDQMSESPGWAVGWYFVPIMNLFRPFQAMKEIWFASHESDGGYEERAPTVLSVWWGLWIVNNVIGYVSMQATMGGAQDATIYINFVAALLNVPLCVALVSIMREIEGSQRHVRHALAFA